MSEISLLSYNIHKGFSLFKMKYLLSSLKMAIERADADIVFLQEILGFHPERRKLEYPDFETQFEYLADKLWPHHAYGKNAIYTNGHHGNAILSRFPFTSWENIDISTHPLERRGLLHAVIDGPCAHQPLHLFCVHLNLLERGRAKQLQHVITRAQKFVSHQAPLVIAGDFNDWRGNVSTPLAQSHGLVEAYALKNGVHACTFPAFKPVLPLDRVYCRGFEIMESRVLKGQPWTKLSDHLPLKVVLRPMSAPQ